MEDDRLHVELRSTPDRAVLVLRGEFDLVGVPLLERELARDAVKDAAAIVLDLSELEFMDSTGLRTMLMAHADAAEREQAFAVTKSGEQVSRLLSVTGVAHQLEIIASADAALR
ncbi:MAG: STAS domain-containing protein [Solirubrobacteraceae bacterium]